jgi:hypothetical protein
VLATNLSTMMGPPVDEPKPGQYRAQLENGRLFVVDESFGVDWVEDGIVSLGSHGGEAEWMKACSRPATAEEIMRVEISQLRFHTARIETFYGRAGVVVQIDGHTWAPSRNPTEAVRTVHRLWRYFARHADVPTWAKAKQ